MRNRFFSILAALLAILFVLTLASCTNNKKSGDDDWMERDVEVNTAPHYARPQKLEGDEDAYQAGERIDLPTIPVN